MNAIIDALVTMFASVLILLVAYGGQYAWGWPGDSIVLSCTLYYALGGSLKR